MGGALEAWESELASNEMLPKEGVACKNVLLLALRSKLRLVSNSADPALQLESLYMAVMELLPTGMLL